MAFIEGQANIRRTNLATAVSLAGLEEETEPLRSITRAPPVDGSDEDEGQDRPEPVARTQAPSTIRT